jgi:hypothetical protein
MGIFVVSGDRHKATKPDKSPLDGSATDAEVQFQEISMGFHE